MPSLLHLPTELIIEVLEHLQPVTELPHPLQSFNPNEWDIRHWGRTLAAVARACRLLHDIAIPLLYSRYEARFQIPIHDFIDRVIEDNTLGPRSIITRNEGPYCAKYKPTAERRSMYRAWGKISSHLKPYGIRNRRQLTTDECAQLEVWMLVRQAPNLEVLSVQNSWSGNFACDLPPVWLLPVVDAATLLFFEVDDNTGWYEHLHTLEVNMNQKCGTYLAFLFALPRLRRLSISSVRWQPADDGIAIEDNIWPDSHPTSKVHVLELEDMDVDADFIVRMIDCCQTLTSFKCDRNTDGIFDSSRPWCEEILGSLQRHGKTLKELTLDPLDQHLGVHPDFEYARFECIRSFERLEFLEVPSMILLGRPAGTTVNGLWSWTHYQPAPATRDIIPPNLQTLVLHMGPAYSPGTQGFEDFFIGGLPPKTDSTGAGLSNGLKAVQVDYMRLPHNASLPMNFWDIQHAYEQAGSAFEYSVILDIDDSKSKASASTSDC